MHIFLDDYRQPKDCLSHMHSSDDITQYYADTEFVVVKDFLSFKDLIDHCLEKYINIESVSFDHDIQHNHYGLSSYDNLTEDNYTGYQCLEYFLENVKDIPVKSISIHTMSDFGHRNMLRLLSVRNLTYLVKYVTLSSYLC